MRVWNCEICGEERMTGKEHKCGGFKELVMLPNSYQPDTKDTRDEYLSGRYSKYYHESAYTALKAEVERLEHNLACLLDHATGGLLSKTNYTKEAMYQAVDDYVERQTAPLELMAERNSKLVSELVQTLEALMQNRWLTRGGMVKVRATLEKAEAHERETKDKE